MQRDNRFVQLSRDTIIETEVLVRLTSQMVHSHTGYETFATEYTEPSASPGGCSADELGARLACLDSSALCDGITHEKWVLGFYGVGEPWVSELFIIKKENDDDSGVISNLASTHLRGRRSQARVVVFLRRVSAESVRSGPSLLGAAPPRAVARIAQRVGRRG